MTINLQELLTTVGAGGVIVWATAWLLKQLISSGLVRETELAKIQIQARANLEIESFKTKLQADANTELERLKNSLQIAAEERRVRFANLHDTRARKVADLYERLLEYSLECQRYVFQMNEGERQGNFHELEKKFRNLYTFFETTRIYLPESVCLSLDELLKEMRSPAIKWFVWGAVNEYASTEQIQQRGQELMSAVQAFDKEIPAAKRALEDEFRKMLGVDP